ncbi:cytochrome c3 family protein, partial [Desulfococcaceae bacterium HSG8]|nr:cytochrome c3 family protein [Desulfococcaceae bacterium HSG8]
IIAVYGIGAQGIEKLSGDGMRADVVTIDTMKIFGELERPEVVFLHDLHTDALEKKNKDCSTCHLSGKNYEIIPDTLKAAVEGMDRMSPKFKRLQDAGRQDVMDIYHTHCIDCHTNMSADGEKSGPVVCGGCHNEDTVTSSAQPMGFDKSLHFRHSKAQEKKCERCHHEFDEKTKKLIHVKEKEDSCRSCHKKETRENRISMKLASHLSCIDCHKKVIAQKKTAGPVKCSGCHDPGKQETIAKLDVVPRMERKQPDLVLIRTATENELPGRMNPVPFDHKAHEEYNDTCRVCHHETMKACNQCHKLEETKEGKGVETEQSMHQLNVDRSCVGCHTNLQKEKNCAGCHVFMEKTRRLESASCFTCHMTPPKGMNMPESGKQLPDEKMAAAASSMLQARKAVTGTYTDEDIPEKVVIKQMVKKYQAVEFPHRKIVHTLVKNIKDNKLANYFHGEEGTLCQGCHHNSPTAKKPPRCGNCHGKPFDEKNPFRPGILGAYHRQCMGCHAEMELEKPVGCTDCHKERS